MLKLEAGMKELVKVGKHKIGIFKVTEKEDIHTYSENKEDLPVPVRGDGRNGIARCLSRS